MSRRSASTSLRPATDAIGTKSSANDNSHDSEMLDQIVLAAEQCFRKYGIQRTRVEDVARRAGLARQNLYRYVSSKDTLIFHVVHRHNKALDDERRRAIPLKGPLHSIVTKSVVLGWKLALEDDFSRDLLSSVNIHISLSYFLDIKRDVVLPDHSYWNRIFDYGKARGELRLDLDYKTMRNAIGLMSLLFIEQSELFPDEETVRSYAERFVTPAVLRESSPAQLSA